MAKGEESSLDEGPIGPGTNPPAESSALHGVIRKAVQSYLSEFGNLRTCPREFWVVQLVNLLDGVAYFSMLTVSTLYLTYILGYSDSQAANLWAACMVVYSGVSFLAGFLGDSLGIKRTLHLSVGIMLLSRLVISFTTSKWAVLPALFAIMVGTAIMTPILIAATKRYTTSRNQTAGFNLLYFMMNIGALIGLLLFDSLVKTQWSYRSIFMLGSTMSLLCWLTLLLFMRRRIGQRDAERRESGSNKVSDATPKAEDKWEAPWTIAASVVKESAFWRFMLFLVILTGVRLIFEHQNQIYPKYYQRTIGPEAMIGKLNSINPAIVCFGAILSTPIVARFKLFNVMFFGICVSAASMLIMAISPGWFCDALGMTLSQGYLTIVILHIVLFSIGEVIWSPRLYEYTAAIAPKGREASYMGLSYIPWVFARLVEGPLAGQLITRYCPEDITDRLTTVPYSQSPQFMCLLLSILALSTPVLIVLFRGVIQREARTNI